MFKCSDCERVFDNPKEIHTIYEALYGVSGEFGSRTPCTYEVCPHCGCDDFYGYYEEDDE